MDKRIIYKAHFLSLVIVIVSSTLSCALSTDWQVNGDAFLSGPNVVITPDLNDQAGSIIYKNKLEQGYDYIFTAEVHLGTRNSSGADGVAFVLHNDPDGIFAVGDTTDGGEWIGFKGIYPAVVFELDTYQNTSRGDPSCDHIGINIVLPSGSGNPDHGGAGPICATSPSSNIEDGNLHTFKVEWDRSSNTFTVSLDGQVRLVYTRDVITDVFSGVTEVYIGFTGSTGAARNLQYITEISVAPDADLEVLKSVDDVTPSENDTITSTISLTNNGPDSAIVEVTDLLPTGLTYVSSNPAQGTYNETNGLWVAGFLAVGGSTTLEIVSTVDSGTAGTTITNTAEVTDSNRFDSNPANDVSAVDINVLPADISIAKVADLANVSVGATVTYTITITNAGFGDASLTEIKDTLPGGFTYETGTTSGLVTSDPTIIGNELNWNGNWVVPRKVGVVDGTLTLSFQALTGGAAGTYYNNLQIFGPSVPIINTGNTAPVTIIVPLIQLVKQVDMTNSTPGGELTYSVTYHNIGDDFAQNLELVDEIPDNTTYVPGSLRMGPAGSTYAVATPKTDIADGDEAEISGNFVIFRVVLLDPDDSVPDSGDDEGVVYFKVTVD